jgi:hypothetical protein
MFGKSSMQQQRSEPFTQSPDAVWLAVKEAPIGIARLSVAAISESDRAIKMSGGITMTTWGQNLEASVTPDGAGTMLHLVGSPRFYSYTAKRRLSTLFDEFVDAVRSRL